LQDLRFNMAGTKPILVLLDVNMPEMSGFEFLEFMELENFPSNIDVIVVTSSIGEKDRLLAEQHPRFVRDLLTKPLQVLKTLRQLTSGRTAHNIENTISFICYANKLLRNLSPKIVCPETPIHFLDMIVLLDCFWKFYDIMCLSFICLADAI